MTASNSVPNSPLMMRTKRKKKPQAGTREADAEPAEAASEDDLLELGDADVAAANDEQPSFPPADVTPAPERAAPRISTGGTLFERMSNLSRGLGRSDDDGKDDDKDDGSSGGLNIPRFLDRQSNN